MLFGSCFRNREANRNDGSILFHAFAGRNRRHAEVDLIFPQPVDDPRPIYKLSHSSADAVIGIPILWGVIVHNLQ